MGAVRLPKIPVLTIDAFVSAQPRGELREGLGTQNCMGSFLSTTDDTSALVYSHPNGPGTRSNGTVWLSRDQARSFRPLAAVTRTPGGSAEELFAYSCMTRMPPGSGDHPAEHVAAAAGPAGEAIGLLYETGDAGCTGPSCRIMFMTVDVPAAGADDDRVAEAAAHSQTPPCSLNGELRDGRCVCDKPWSGPSCARIWVPDKIS